MIYEGSCHCKAVVYKVETENVISEAGVCNCSHCHRKGFVLYFSPRDKFSLESGESNLISYRFNTKKIEHLFCGICGVDSFGDGVSPDGSKTTMVNLRTVTSPLINIDEIKINKFNGKDW